MNKRLIAILSILSLLVFLPLIPANAAVKAGAKCIKVGSTSVVSKKTYTCIKSGKKLVWDKGVLVKPTPTPTPTPPFTQSSRSVAIDSCKLKYKNQWEMGFGFPRSPNRLPNSGLIKAIFIFVDFSDAPGTDQPAVVAKNYFEEFNEYYKSVSYGKVSFSYSVPDRYFRINKPSSSYRMNMKKGELNPAPEIYFQDALKAADPTVDFSGFDVVYVIPSNSNTEIVYGPAFPQGLGNETLKTDEKIFYSGAVGGTDSRLQENSLEWVWLAHETGHLFGLLHPWRVQSTPQGATTIGPEVAIWDLMLAMWKFSPKAHEFLGWTRFLLSWISDDQVNCQDISSISSGDFRFKLTPIEVNTPTDKLAIIRLSETKALVIEVRRNLGFDKIPAEYEGTLMYLVDVTKGSNEGMATLVSSNTRLVNGVSIGTMKVGSSVEVANMRIEVLFSDDQGDYIQVTKN